MKFIYIPLKILPVLFVLLIVSCSSDSSSPKIDANECAIAGTVYPPETQSLDLSKKGLSELPDCIGELKNLQLLKVHENNLTTLPESINELINLSELWLSLNKISSIPENIGNLKKLSWFSLTNNHVKSLPASINELKNNLKTLYLGNNPINLQEKEKIENWLPNTKIYWTECNIAGVTYKLENSDINLSNKNLTSIPECLGYLVNIEFLDLSKNQLSKLPDSFIFLDENLKTLDLSYNNFNIEQRNIIESWYPNTEVIWGPCQIAGLDFDDETKEIDLSNKNLFSIPDCIGLLSNLEKLNLLSNKLNQLPVTFGNLNKLTLLQLSDNLFDDLPASLSNLINLKQLGLSYNNFTEAPLYIFELINLETLHLQGNFINNLSANIGNLTKLKELLLTDNQISTLPTTIGNLSDLNLFYADDNLLQELPSEIGNLSNIRFLWLSNNQLISLPEEIGNLTNMEFLVLSNNQLTTLPETIKNLSNSLKVLSLVGNNFSQETMNEIESWLPNTAIEW